MSSRSQNQCHPGRGSEVEHLWGKRSSNGFHSSPLSESHWEPKPVEAGEGYDELKLLSMISERAHSVGAQGCHSDKTLEPSEFHPMSTIGPERPLTFGMERPLIDSCLAITLAGAFVAKGLR